MFAFKFSVHWMSARTCYHSQFIHIWRWAALFIFSAFCRIEANFVGREKKGIKGTRMTQNALFSTMEKALSFPASEVVEQWRIFHRFSTRDYFARQRKCIKILSPIVSFQHTSNEWKQRLSNKTSENSTSNKRVTVVSENDFLLWSKVRHKDSM